MFTVHDKKSGKLVAVLEDVLPACLLADALTRFMDAPSDVRDEEGNIVRRNGPYEETAGKIW